MAKSYKIEGTVSWFKALGEPVENYNQDGNEWTFDLTPNQKGLDLFNRLGLQDKLKDKDDDRDTFITFKRREFNKQTDERNEPIEVLDTEGKPWDENIALGNGTRVKVKFGVFEGKFKGKPYTKIVPYSVTVLELKEFVKKEKKEKAAKPQSNKPAAKGNDWDGEGEE